MRKIHLVSAIAGGALAIAGAAACGDGVTPAPSSSPSPIVTSAPVTTPPVTPTTKPVPTASTGTPTDPPTTPPVITLEQANAAGSAADYLSGGQHFSRKGLIEQLKYEGYSTKDATRAVDSLHADWNAQAVGDAKDYLDQDHFSRSGLIGQLEYDGYSASQAAYGVKGAGL